jgi:hypothetical protein
MTFYDYDMTFDRAGNEHYALRAHCKRLPIGSCTIVHDSYGWRRRTVWHSKHGARIEFYRDLDAALTSGIRWARRREAQDRREAAARARWQAERDRSRC